MKFRTNGVTTETMFGVPFIIADNFLNFATGEEIKVLLYILRNTGIDITAEEISASTGVSPQDVEKSVELWQRLNVISSDNSPNQSQPVSNVTPVPDSIQSAQIQTAVPDTEISNSVKENNLKPVSPASTKSFLRPSEIDEIVKGNPDIAELFQIVQGTIINPNPIMRNSLLWIHEYLGLKTEVILTLLNYCATIDCINPNYIEKIARSWAEKGIDTINMAENEVARLIKSRSYTGQIMNMFDMKRNPTTSQQGFIDKWEEENYSMEMIKYAYELTIEQIEKLSFPYINKILVSWKENGFKTIDDAKNAVSDRKKNYKPKNNSNSDGFDADEYDIFWNNF